MVLKLTESKNNGIGILAIYSYFSEEKVLSGEGISLKYVTIILLFVLFVAFYRPYWKDFNCANAFMSCLDFFLGSALIKRV